MTVKEKRDKWELIPFNKIIIGLSSLVFTWILTPSLFSYQTAMPIVFIIVLVMVLICLNKELSVQERRDIIFRYFCCGLVSLFFWMIERRDSFSFVAYAANNLIIWFPIAFSFYLIYRQPKVAWLKMILSILLFFSILTGITTLIGLQQFPMASRWLAGAHTPEMIATLRSMNIGGYSYIYAMGLMFPLAIGLFLYSNQGMMIRFLSLIALLLLPIVIFYSQYMIALYMVIFSVLAIIIFALADGLKRIVHRKTLHRNAMIIVLPLAALLFFVVRVPVHFAIRDVALKYGLKSLESRANSVLLSSTTAEFQDEIWKTLNQEDGLFDEDFNAQGDAMVARSQVYSQLINTVSHSPFFGRLTDKSVRISNHSEFLDGLLGGGIFGGIFYLSMLYLIFSKLIWKVLATPTKLYGSAMLMGCLLVGLGAVNTLTKSREILLMCSVFPVVSTMFLGYASDSEHFSRTP